MNQRPVTGEPEVVGTILPRPRDRREVLRARTRENLADLLRRQAGTRPTVQEDEVRAFAVDATRERAEVRGTTLRAVFEEGLLPSELAADEEPADFTLRDASVDGSGLQPEFRRAGWAEVRAAAYEGRGG